MVKIIGGPPWKVSIYFRWSESGRPYRERRLVPPQVTGRAAAMRWGQARAAGILAQGEIATASPPVVATSSAIAPAAQAITAIPLAPTAIHAPRLREFAPRWIEGHAEALRQKRCGIEAKKGILRRFLVPELGELPLDQITTERVARLCVRLARLSRKSLANVLEVLAKLLRVAVDWDVISAMPCKIKIPKATRTPPTFYDLETMRRLIDAAAAIDARTHALVLLGLHGGLRRSELLGLEWEDVSLERRQITVRRAVISKYVDTPKSGHGRVIELSTELTRALETHLAASSHKKGRVFRQDSGSPALAQHLYKWMDAARAGAGIPKTKGARLHVMRHSACSALAAMGAPMIAIQALAGHESPQTTARYMHLAPGLQAAAVALFDQVRGTNRGTP
jgi:integrase